MNEKKFELMKCKKSANFFNEVIGFDTSWLERGGAEIVDGSIMQLAQLDAWIASVNDSPTERQRRVGHRQNLYVESCGGYLIMADEQLVGDICVYTDF